MKNQSMYIFEDSYLDQEVSNKRKEQLMNAMSAADLYYDIIDSHEGYLVFRAEGGTQYTFTDWLDVSDWIHSVVFDDPDQNEAAERILCPALYE